MPEVPTAIPAAINITVHLWANTVDLCLPKIDNDIKFSNRFRLIYKKFFIITGVFYDTMLIFETYCHLGQTYNTLAGIASHFHLLSPGYTFQ
jgi:hypothetical protein